MRIRAIEPEDLELLYTIENDMSLWWISSQTAPLSRYHLRDYIANNEADIYKDDRKEKHISFTDCPDGEWEFFYEPKANLLMWRGEY